MLLLDDVGDDDVGGMYDDNDGENDIDDEVSKSYDMMFPSSLLLCGGCCEWLSSLLLTLEEENKRQSKNACLLDSQSAVVIVVVVEKQHQIGLLCGTSILGRVLLFLTEKERGEGGI